MSVYLAFQRISCAYDLCQRSIENKNMAREDFRYLKVESLWRRLVNISSSDTGPVCAEIFDYLGKYGSVRERLRFAPNGRTEPDMRVSRCLGVINGWKRESRAAGALWRVERQSEEDLRQGWYLIMDTLTIDRRFGLSARDILCSNGWHTYKQRWREIVRKACGYSRDVKQREYIWYFGCVQFGDAGKNPHIHVLWGCRKIPDTWLIDPNAGRSVPNRREISAAKPTWDYGYSTPVAVRTGLDDVWAKHGWCWPVDGEGLPMPVLGAFGAAKYIGRYMAKPEEGDWKCRTRMSQGLGMASMKNWLRTLPSTRLKLLATLNQVETVQEEWKSQLNVSSSLLSSLASKERLDRCLSRRPRLTLRVLTRRRYLACGLISKLRASLRHRPPQGRFSVCSDWLADVVRREWLVFDDRAERDLQYLVETVPRRMRGFNSGLIGRSVYGSV